MVGGSLRVLPASSTTKTDRHDIAEILLKVAFKHQKSNQSLTDKQTRKAYKYTFAALHFSIYCTLTASMFQFHLFLKNICQKNGVGVKTTFYLGDTYVPAMQ